ncbi:TPA: hypothetical protein QCV77_004391 [Bacillus thuringiensis]|nr:hypothetical protein [Bacillus thuringiensis]
MLIYTVMMYFHADTDIMLATLDKEQALKEFKSDSMYSLQIWEDGELLIELWCREHSVHSRTYEPSRDLNRYSQKGQKLFKEIVEELK